MTRKLLLLLLALAFVLTFVYFGLLTQVNGMVEYTQDWQPNDDEGRKSHYHENGTTAMRTARTVSVSSSPSWRVSPESKPSVADGSLVQSTTDRPNITSRRPPFESLLDESGEINADASSLLDFSIAGFPKCGTTTMIKTLAQIAQAPAGDTCQGPKSLIRSIYNVWDKNFGGSDKLLRGIKCPQFVETQLPLYRQYFPSTKLIVGIRHPVRWFESFNNFQVQARGDIGPVYDRIGGCGKKLFCTHRARFHLFLAQMGKTPLSRAEKELIPHKILNHNITNPLFLYEVGQLADNNTTRQNKFWEDVAAYIDYPEVIPRQQKVKPGKKIDDLEKQNLRDKLKMDICSDEYDRLRAVLMTHAWQISVWIQEYLLEVGRNVYVSSKPFLKELLESYKYDPCGKLVRYENGTFGHPL